jgi:lipopolysaccharide/colanic/teichoic acid biosynthesis glycosyltransferase
VKESVGKRLFDMSLSLVGLVLSLPLWIVIALVIWIDDGRPILYKQRRIGKDGRLFDLLKFRSMVKDAEKHTGAVWATENDARVTRVGRLLRKTAMDELPQLVNIAKGDISFVGPRSERPELVSQFVKELPHFSRRHAVRPGLTGLAQVYGRYDSPPRHKLRYDLLYIKHGGFALDLKLILLSFWITLRGRWESREKKV